MAAIEVHDVEADDQPEWHRMWMANCAHFGALFTDAQDRELWRRILDPGHPVRALMARRRGIEEMAAGFANYVLHPHTFSDRLVCYLEDLWVEPSARSVGVGRALIDALIARGRDRGWRRIYWHTEADNAAARALYDRIARLTGYVRYDIVLP